VLNRVRALKKNNKYRKLKMQGIRGGLSTTRYKQCGPELGEILQFNNLLCTLGQQKNAL
jgi:hypothetical protein